MASRPASPTVMRELYFAEDTGDLYFGAGDPLVWKKYSVMPVGTLMLFEGACPPGWSRYATADGMLLRGAPAGVWSGFVHEAATTHTHTLPDVIAHSHTVAAQAGLTLTADGVHDHDYIARAGAGVGDKPYEDNWQSTQAINTSDAGAHSHAVSFPAHVTDSAGSVAAASDAASSLPPYVKYVFCEKG